MGAKIADFTREPKAPRRIRASHLSALDRSPAAGPWSKPPCGCERRRIARCLVSAELSRRVDSRAALSVRARDEAADLDEGGRAAFRPQRAGIQAIAEKRLQCGPRAAASPPSFAPDSIAPALAADVAGPGELPEAGGTLGLPVCRSQWCRAHVVRSNGLAPMTVEPGHSNPAKSARSGNESNAAKYQRCRQPGQRH